MHGAYPHIHTHLTVDIYESQARGATAWCRARGESQVSCLAHKCTFSLPTQRPRHMVCHFNFQVNECACVFVRAHEVAPKMIYTIRFMPHMHLTTEQHSRHLSISLIDSNTILMIITWTHETRASTRHSRARVFSFVIWRRRLSRQLIVISKCCVCVKACVLTVLCLALLFTEMCKFIRIAPCRTEITHARANPNGDLRTKMCW